MITVTIVVYSLLETKQVVVRSHRYSLDCLLMMFMIIWWCSARSRSCFLLMTGTKLNPIMILYWTTELHTQRAGMTNVTRKWCSSILIRRVNVVYRYSPFKESCGPLKMAFVAFASNDAVHMRDLYPACCLRVVVWLDSNKIKLQQRVGTKAGLGCCVEQRKNKYNNFY